MALIRSATRDTPFELDRVDIRLLEEPDGVLNGLFIGYLVTPKGHVADHKCVGRAPPHGLAVDNALVHGHGDGALIAVHAHAKGIPHQDHVHVRGLGKPGCWKVVGCDPGDFFPL